AGTGTNVDTTSSPGDVKLASSPAAVDQQQLTTVSGGLLVSTTQWIAQSFTAGASGNLTSVELQMGQNAATTGPIAIEIRSNNGGFPSTTVLASTSVAAFSNTSATTISASFNTPPAVVAGTTYHIVAREVSGTGNYFIVGACSASQGPGCNPYTGGSVTASTNSGSTWGNTQKST